ncbi:unnamed protein product, partial [Arabidopsis halleri]
MSSNHLKRERRFFFVFCFFLWLNFFISIHFSRAALFFFFAGGPHNRCYGS